MAFPEGQSVQPASLESICRSLFPGYRLAFSSPPILTQLTPISMTAPRGGYIISDDGWAPNDGLVLVGMPLNSAF